MTREEKNRKLAEWLGIIKPLDAIAQRHIPDFYASEGASAMIRRKMRETHPYMVLHREDGREIVRFVRNAWPIITANGETELEAIAEAALSWMENCALCGRISLAVPIPK